jgi:hypothetical protein
VGDGPFDRGVVPEVVSPSSVLFIGLAFLTKTFQAFLARARSSPWPTSIAARPPLLPPDPWHTVMG